jgi:hypothetical protein
MFAAAVFTHVNRARRYDPRYLAGEDDVAALTLSWRDVHDNKLVPLDVVVRLAGVQMVGREGEPAHVQAAVLCALLPFSWVVLQVWLKICVKCWWHA